MFKCIVTLWRYCELFRFKASREAQLLFKSEVTY